MKKRTTITTEHINAFISAIIILAFLFGVFNFIAGNFKLAAVLFAIPAAPTCMAAVANGLPKKR